MSDEKIKQFKKLDGVIEYIALFASIQNICHRNLAPIDVIASANNLFNNSFLRHHQHLALFDDPQNVEDFRCWIHMVATRHYMMAVKQIDQSKNDNDFPSLLALNDECLICTSMESDTISFGDNVIGNFLKETNNTNSFTIGDIVENMDLFNLDITSQNETYFDCEVNNHEQVEVTENIDVIVNSNPNGIVPPDTYNDVAPMSTSAELFNDTVSETAQVSNSCTKQEMLLRKEPMYTFSGARGKPFNKELKEFNMLTKTVNWKDILTEFKKRYVCKTDPNMILKEVRTRPTTRSRKNSNCMSRVFQCECQQIGFFNGEINEHEIIDLQFSYSEKDAIIHNNDILYLYHVKTREVPVEYAIAHFEKLGTEHDVTGKSNTIELIQDKETVKVRTSEAKRYQTPSLNRKKFKKVRTGEENSVMRTLTECDITIENSRDSNRKDSVAVAVRTMQKCSVAKATPNVGAIALDRKERNTLQDNLEEDTDEENTVIVGKTDPNERNNKVDYHAGSQNGNETEAAENVQYPTTDESEDKSKSKKQNELKRNRIAMQLFSKKHMLTVTELKMKKGFYDVPFLCEKDEAEIKTENKMNSERCMICVAAFEEGDEVAVNHGCGKPHCVHIACFYQYISTPSLREKENMDGPNLLMKLKGCPICPDKYSPIWSEWKFSTIVTSNWKKGKKLPNKDKSVHGVHQYDDGHIKFTHFITDIELYNAINAYINNVTFHQRETSSGGTRSQFYIYHRYETFMTSTFTCHECTTEVYMWKSVYLRECKSHCKYRICRDCFIKCVLAKNKYNECLRMRGILPCPLCSRSRQAHFMLTKEPCLHQYRQFLFEDMTAILK